MMKKNKNKSRQITAPFFIKYMHRLQQIIPEVMTKEDTNPTTLLLIRQVKSLVLLLLPLLMMRLWKEWLWSWTRNWTSISKMLVLRMTNRIFKTLKCNLVVMNHRRHPFVMRRHVLGCVYLNQLTNQISLCNRKNMNHLFLNVLVAAMPMMTFVRIRTLGKLTTSAKLMWKAVKRMFCNFMPNLIRYPLVWIVPPPKKSTLLSVVKKKDNASPLFIRRVQRSQLRLTTSTAISHIKRDWPRLSRQMPSSAKLSILKFTVMKMKTMFRSWITKVLHNLMLLQSSAELFLNAARSLLRFLMLTNIFYFVKMPFWLGPYYFSTKTMKC